jgi:hypothetical protein
MPKYVKLFLKIRYQVLGLSQPLIDKSNFIKLKKKVFYVQDSTLTLLSINEKGGSELIKTLKDFEIFEKLISEIEKSEVKCQLVAGFFKLK